MIEFKNEIRYSDYWDKIVQDTGTPPWAGESFDGGNRLTQILKERLPKFPNRKVKLLRIL